MSARPAMAVPPAKGLDEACAWLRKATLTPFPLVTKFDQDHCHRTRLGRELNCGTSAASLSESSCLLHESRTTTFVEEEEDTYGTSAARQSASSYLLHESRTNIIVRRDVSICLSSDLSTHAILRSIYLSTDISTTHSISACIHKYL